MADDIKWDRELKRLEIGMVEAEILKLQEDLFKRHSSETEEEFRHTFLEIQGKQMALCEGVELSGICWNLAQGLTLKKHLSQIRLEIIQGLEEINQTRAEAIEGLERMTQNLEKLIQIHERTIARFSGIAERVKK